MLPPTRTLALPGCTLAYGDSGASNDSSAPVLFLHGAGADHAMFAVQAAAVAATGRRTVVCDLRAHGASRPNRAPLTAERLVADIESLVAATGLERPVLVGHSLGGNLAQELVRRRPSSYSALVVMDATWNAGPLRWVERGLLGLAAPGLALIPAHRLPGVMARASAVTEPARAELTREFAQIPKREFLAVWRATTELVRPAPGYRTPVPLHLLRGERDRTGNIARAMPAWAAHEGVRERVVQGAGHTPSLDAPAHVTAALLEMLAR